MFSKIMIRSNNYKPMEAALSKYFG